MKESQIQKQIMEYLKNLDNIYFFRSSSGKLHLPNGRFFATGKPGCPDITCCYMGRYIGLEVKTSSGRQTTAQIAAEECIKKAGGEYYIVRSADDAAKVINKECD